MKAHLGLLLMKAILSYNIFVDNTFKKYIFFYVKSFQKVHLVVILGNGL